ncbi:DUF7373 family lipoprotein [Nocardia aurantiaca]|uniref:Uncharacterized protein n=1 Tax=Nocardia aurantiaca TaxID=2675850 RepID=A0A6I3KLW5_9NOCA|nr:hypothetical protein [Nocardia aurantiaca]MTE11583.1 hypothetical protein [Nocardia aurantiaca]
MRYGTGRLRSVRLRAAAAAVLAITALTTTGCGFDSHATAADSVDLSKLDTGSYATAPRPVTATDASGRITEALRLGNAMPLPMEIDPALTHGDGGVHPFAHVSEVLRPEMNGGHSAFGWLNEAAFTNDPAGFVAGFATAARTDADESLGYRLTDVVMVFDNDGDAAAAAAAAGANGFLDVGFGTGEPAQSSAHPAAHLSWLPGDQYLATFYPTGKYLILTLVDNTENFYAKISDLPDLIAKSDKTIDVTADKLKSFQPTAPDQVDSLPVDPQGLLRLILPRPAGDQTAHAFDGVLDRHGALHTESDVVLARSLYDKAGVDAVAYGAGALYRTRDENAAKDFVKSNVDKFLHRIDSPPGLPSAFCVKYHGPDVHAFPFTCSVVYGHYVATVWSQQQQDVFQRISAQYAMLANGK